MIPNGFGNAIPSFENAYGHTGRDTPYLTNGPTPWSTSRRPAFAFPSHRVSTLATHLGQWQGGRCFYNLFCSRTSTPSTGSATAPSSAWWWSGWSWTGGSGGRAAHRRTTPFFVDRGDGIGMRNVANASTSSPFLSIFIEQIQPSP